MVWQSLHFAALSFSFSIPLHVFIVQQKTSLCCAQFQFFNPRSCYMYPEAYKLLNSFQPSIENSHIKFIWESTFEGHADHFWSDFDALMAATHWQLQQVLMALICSLSLLCHGNDITRCFHLGELEFFTITPICRATMTRGHCITTTWILQWTYLLIWRCIDTYINLAHLLSYLGF